MREQWNPLVILLSGLAMVAAVADNATTVVCIQRLGEVVVETNPLSRFLIAHWGVVPAMVANASWSILLIVWLASTYNQYRSRFALVVMVLIILSRGWAALHNFGIILTAL